MIDFDEEPTKPDARGERLRWTQIDGDYHTTRRDCCSPVWEPFNPCRKCGGFVHVQPVYGGLADSCEICDAANWRSDEAPCEAYIEDYRSERG